MIRTLPKPRIALVALLAALSGAAAAQNARAPATPPRYRVELIVFANLAFNPGQELFEPQAAPLAIPELRVFDDAWLQEQQDLSNLSLPDGAGAPPVTMPVVEPPFRPLAPEELELTPQYQRLERSANFRPILHGGWVQDVVSESRTEPVRLTLLGVTNPTGTISLYRNNFLHLRLDVIYEDRVLGSRPQVSQDPFPAGGGDGSVGGSAFGGGFGLDPFELAPRYRLEQSRQTRSGVLQHFDHPAFGVLVKVTEVPRATAPGTPQRPEP